MTLRYGPYDRLPILDVGRSEEGQCVIIETMNSLYHATVRESVNGWRWNMGGGKYLLSTQPIAMIGSVVDGVDVDYQTIQTKRCFMFVRGVDMKRLITSPVQHIELLPTNHAPYTSRIVKLPLIAGEHGVKV